MRVAIVGSRTFPELSRVWAYVAELPADTVVVSGGARGVDQAAAAAARRRGLKVEEHLPDYAAFGRRAPILRNHRIVESADRVAAFWDGSSRGTENAIYIAERLGKRVEVFKPQACR